MPGPQDSQIATVVQPNAGAAPLEGAFVITVTEGPDKGLTFTLDDAHASRVLVGQSPACDLRLTDREVSRRHVSLEMTDRGIRIVDLGSTNGTFVDRVKIHEAELLGGEMLRVGSSVLTIEHESTAAVPRLTNANRFGKILGASREMRRLYPLCERLALSTVPVILEGETGTGKEVLAESLHEVGPRAAGPFIVFDCTAAPPNLVESELFGHERGAFTGAVSQRKGVFEQAHGGTLLIDEIGDLEQALQPKLLRAIERSEIRRVGGDRWIKVDVRVLAATRRDLDREVQAGRFRDDLFHRLAVGRIELPPLRHRRGDVGILARYMWRELGGDERRLPADVLLKWEDYEWPGNVRELRNAVARQLALGELAGMPRVEWNEPAEQEPPRSGGSPDDPIERVIGMRLPFVQARERIMQEFERRYVARVLSEHGGDVAKAAAASGIGRRYFQMIRARNR
jgi:transcriptional regulator with GAF, ATPase, and Fis domain